MTGAVGIGCDALGHVGDVRLGGVASLRPVERDRLELEEAFLAAVKKVGAGAEVGALRAGASVECAVDQVAQECDVATDCFDFLRRVSHTPRLPPILTCSNQYRYASQAAS
jgi:hypothetical protein